MATLKANLSIRFMSILMSAVALFGTLIDDTVPDDWLLMMVIVEFFMVGMGAAFVVDTYDGAKR